MEKCFRCEKSGKEVRLHDAIYENDIVKICDRCAVIERVPVIRKPSTSQLKESERNQTVYQRLKKISGLNDEKQMSVSILEEIRRLDEHPELEKPEPEKPFNLIDNFHWHITRARRNKGLSTRQLAWSLGESEAAINMVEKGDLPEEPEKLIRKLEQFLQLKLRERTKEELEKEKKKQRENLREASRIPRIDVDKVEESFDPISPILEEPELDELDIIPLSEEEIIDIEEEVREKERIPSRVLTFRKEALDDLTIDDLKRIKEEQEKQERVIKAEKERAREIQAESLIKNLNDKERYKIHLKEEISKEMKDIALGKMRETEISEKKEILSNGVKKLSGEEKERIPTIYDLMEKKKEREQGKLLGKDIEVAEKEEESKL